jgi:ubiquinol-cytochrome c reductase cytochrome b subunit
MFFKKDWEPYDEKPPGKGHSFFPHHTIEQGIVVIIAFCILLFLTTFYPVPYEKKADPFDTPEHVKPEWYFLANYQFLKIAEKLEFIGQWAPKVLGVTIQGFLILLIMLYPFLDKNPQRHPLKRKFSMFLSFLFLVLYIALTIWGKYS